MKKQTVQRFKRLADTLPEIRQPREYRSNPKVPVFRGVKQEGVRDFTLHPTYPINHKRRLKRAFERGGNAAVEAYLAKIEREQIKTGN